MTVANTAEPALTLKLEHIPTVIKYVMNVYEFFTLVSW